MRDLGFKAITVKGKDLCFRHVGAFHNTAKIKGIYAGRYDVMIKLENGRQFAVSANQDVVLEVWAPDGVEEWSKW